MLAFVKLYHTGNHQWKPLVDMGSTPLLVESIVIRYDAEAAREVKHAA